MNRSLPTRPDLSCDDVLPTASLHRPPSCRLLAASMPAHGVPALMRGFAHRLLEASLVVEFALAHGLQWREDDASASMLADFMLRVQEWGGDDAASTEQVHQLDSSSQHCTTYVSLAERLPTVS